MKKHVGKEGLNLSLSIQNILYLGIKRDQNFTTPTLPFRDIYFKLCIKKQKTQKEPLTSPFPNQETQTSVPTQLNKGKLFFQQTVLGQLTLKRIQLFPFFTPYTKNSFKMDYKLKVSDTTIKLLQENVGTNLVSLGYPKSFHT